MAGMWFVSCGSLSKDKYVSCILELVVLQPPRHIGLLGYQNEDLETRLDFTETTVIRVRKIGDSVLVFQLDRLKAQCSRLRRHSRFWAGSAC